jgi:hypothetical protein
VSTTISMMAKVHQGIFAKADRLFRNDDAGVWVELLQNPRHTNAARVDVSIDESQSRPGTGTITIHDNGLGISDFQALLGLGGSGWEGETQIKEDPAGMGFFALCRSEVQVHSGNHRVHLSPDVFLGKDAAEIIEMAETIQGTRICFTGDSSKVALISSLQPDWLRDPPA